jgi:hypothetical protein
MTSLNIQLNNRKGTLTMEGGAGGAILRRDGVFLATSVRNAQGVYFLEMTDQDVLELASTDYKVTILGATPASYALERTSDTRLTLRTFDDAGAAVDVDSFAVTVYDIGAASA